MKWIKLSTNAFNDEAIKLIEAMPESDAILVIWIKLLCLAGSEENDGVFVFKGKRPYTDEMLATLFNQPLATVRLALQVFEEFDMTETMDGVLTITNWNEYQGSEKIEKMRVQHAARQKRYREKQKNKSLIGKTAGENKSDVYGDVTVTRTDIDIDIDIQKEKESNKEKEKATGKSRFRAPSRAEVCDYIEKQGYSVDADRFIAYYESNGWKVGKNPMRDWKAAVRSWESRDKPKAVSNEFSKYDL